VNKNILDIQDLNVSFQTFYGDVQAVRGVNLTMNYGEVVALVGESGSGKSVTANSILKLLPETSKVKISGKIIFDGEEITKWPEDRIMTIRGSNISMIFQDPMASLNPTMRTCDQIMEVLMKHQNLKRKAAYEKAIEMLNIVGIPDPEKRARQYPFEFSGGMKQRVMIAMALACRPKLLIADEPTTALDVTIQAQILELLKKLKSQMKTSILLITHDLGVVANAADRVYVMYGGKIAETANVFEIFENPRHPYTSGLMKSIPSIDCSIKERLNPIEGNPPELLNPPSGCAFYPRCPFKMNICMRECPEDFKIDENHISYCWLNHKSAPNVDIKHYKKEIVNE
jgi:oligopeptide transport system ATP-binding protein